MAKTVSPTRWYVIIFIPAVILLSCYFIYQAQYTIPTDQDPAPLNSDFYTLTTARGTDLLNKPIVGNCFICHAYWVPIPKSEQNSKPRFAHANIVLDHGKNDRCYNCHMISDRNKYVADDGSGIMSQLPEQLCSRCHGLIYNDWLIGTHGKWTGKWQPSGKNDRKTYTCTECHDPHAPTYKYNSFAPPPVWPEKYIRTELEDSSKGPFSNFLIDEEPKEIF